MSLGWSFFLLATNEVRSSCQYRNLNYLPEICMGTRFDTQVYVYRTVCWVPIPELTWPIPEQLKNNTPVPDPLPIESTRVLECPRKVDYTREPKFLRADHSFTYLSQQKKKNVTILLHTNSIAAVRFRPNVCENFWIVYKSISNGSFMTHFHDIVQIDFN